jgi:hypothetical protein
MGGAVGVNESGPAGAANLEKVDHVVVLMLENRSFDHMRGYLSLTGGRPEIDGLRPGLANEDQGRTYPVHHLAATTLEMDPDHSASAIDQQVADGNMSGFVASAAATLARRGVDDGDPSCARSATASAIRGPRTAAAGLRRARPAAASPGRPGAAGRHE